MISVSTENSSSKHKSANKALHWTAIPLRSIAAGELGRSARNVAGVVSVR